MFFYFIGGFGLDNRKLESKITGIANQKKTLHFTKEAEIIFLYLYNLFFFNISFRSNSNGINSNLQEEYQICQSMKPITLEQQEEVIKYIYLVEIRAHSIKKTLPQNLEFDDLKSEGMLGLIDGIQKLNANSNEVSIRKYLSIRINGAIYDYLRRLDYSQRERFFRKKCEKAEMNLFQKETEINEENLAKELGMELDEFQKKKTQYSNAVYFLEDLISRQADDGNPKELMLPGSFADPVEIIETKEKLAYVSLAFSQLNENKKNVIKLYYFEGFIGKEIADILNVAESRVSQLISKGIDEMKKKIHNYQINYKIDLKSLYF